jgi:polysaccharide export outer membrane protein
MDNVIGEGNIGADIPIKQYDVVFIPRTKLATAALSGEQLWRLIPFSFSVSGTYSLGG